VVIGPVVDSRQLESNLAWIEKAKAEGATLAFGGERLQRDTEGFYQSPALFVDTRNDMEINREEAFGPIACVIKVRDYEAPSLTLNITQYGPDRGHHHPITPNLPAISRRAPKPAAQW